MKKLFLCILMVLPVAILANEHGRCGNFATYYFDEQNNTLTISGYGEMYKYDSEDDVPWQSYKDKIYNIVVESEITSIGDYAFAYCSEANSVSVPSSITKIERYAFAYCKGLSQMTIPPYIEYIEECAFEHSDIVDVYIPESCLSIGDHAFSYSLIENFQMELRGFGGQTPLNIGDDAFWGCPHLSYVNLRAAFIEIDSGNPFGLCYNLLSIDGWGIYTGEKNGYEIKDGCLYRFSENGDILELICCPGGKTSWKAPEHLKSIGDYAFAGCKKIANFDIPNTVKTIGQFAFALSNCSDTAYHRVFISESVEEVGLCVWGWFSANFDIYLNSTKVKRFNNVVSSTRLGTLHIPYGMKASYDIDYLERFFTIFDDIGDDHITIEDGLLFDNDFVRENTTITYSRDFTNTNWQSLYVPFSIPVDSLKAHGLQVAELNDTHQWDFNGDGVADSTRVEFFTLTSGSTEANYPYLIRATEPTTLSLTLKDIEVKAAEENSIECSSTKQKFTFVGTYTGVSGADMYNNNYYGMSGGGLKRVSNNTVSLKPQRWYMKIENKNGSPVNYFAPSIRFTVDGIDEEEEETSAIVDMCTESRNCHKAFYSLEGIRQHTAPTQRGMYVHQGKKLIIR